MRYRRLVRLVWIAGVVGLCTPAAIAGQPDRIVVDGFETPESVVHDTIADCYLVSNVGVGNPGALDHNGFISRVSPSGVILDRDWIRDGVGHVSLNGPKGMALHGDALYVADIDTLRVFDRFTGKPRRSIPIPNPFAPASLFLNDVVVDTHGNAYLSDNRNGAIFIVDPDRRASLLISGAQLGGPNGLLLDHGSLSWVTFFGHDIKRLTRSGRLLTEATLPLPDASLPGLPPGALFLDGYARDEGDLLVSSWISGKVYRVGRSGTEITTVAEFVSALDNPALPEGPADMAIDKVRNRLLIPLFNAHQLVIVQLGR